MRVPRIFLPASLATGEIVSLDTRAHHHLINVLRLNEGDSVSVFNGAGGEYAANLTLVSRKASHVLLREFHQIERESNFQIRLLQGISRNEHMDHTLQKAVELGVHTIVPVITERTGGRLNGERLEKKLRHWQGILISACEQCGRNQLPLLERPLSVQDISELMDSDSGIVLMPGAKNSLGKLQPDRNEIFNIVIGAEGGLTDREEDTLIHKGFTPVCLGQRILRTETAGVATVAIVQMLWGDLAQT